MTDVIPSAARNPQVPDRAPLFPVPSSRFPVFMRLLNNLTFRVLVAITLGVILGVVSPGTAKAMRPLGDTFVNLVKMVIAPIVFFTIVLGIATLGDLKRVGRVGGKALLYFEVVT